jgi:hypothetical protein
LYRGSSKNQENFQSRKCHIILDDDGYVMDGRHRIAKAILTGEKSIKFVRFDVTHSPDFYEEE